MPCLNHPPDSAISLVSISGDTLLCEGDTTVLTCSTANAYIWSTGETSKSIRVGESGVYTVVVTNTMGCTNSASLNVHVDSYPAIVISGDTILCQGQQSMLYAYGGASYLWDDGTTSPEVTVIAGIRVVRKLQSM